MSISSPSIHSPPGDKSKSMGIFSERSKKRRPEHHMSFQEIAQLLQQVPNANHLDLQRAIEALQWHQGAKIREISRVEEKNSVPTGFFRRLFSSTPRKKAQTPPPKDKTFSWFSRKKKSERNKRAHSATRRKVAKKTVSNNPNTPPYRHSNHKIVSPGPGSAKSKGPELPPSSSSSNESHAGVSSDLAQSDPMLHAQRNSSLATINLALPTTGLHVQPMTISAIQKWLSINVPGNNSLFSHVQASLDQYRSQIQQSSVQQVPASPVLSRARRKHTNSFTEANTMRVAYWMQETMLQILQRATCLQRFVYLLFPSYAKKFRSKVFVASPNELGSRDLTKAISNQIFSQAQRVRPTFVVLPPKTFCEKITKAFRNCRHRLCARFSAVFRNAKRIWQSCIQKIRSCLRIRSSVQ